AGAASFQQIPHLPGSVNTLIYGISGDGSTAVGQSAFSGGTAVPFRWTEASGTVPLSAPTVYFDEAYDASYDGSVVGVKYVNLAGVWAVGSDVLDLSPAGVTQAATWGVSGDGTTVVGHQSSGEENSQAFRWSAAEGVTALTANGVPVQGFATSASYDGSVVSGYGRFAGVTQPYRWTETTGAVPLGSLRTDGSAGGRAYAVSPDGAFVVGGAETDSGATQAFLWTELGGMIDLSLGASISVADSNAQDVSADGRIVVGDTNCCGLANWGGFVWTAETGMLDFQAVLTEQLGLGQELEGWTLRTVEGVSDDGRVFVGYGRNANGGPNGWIVRLDEPLFANPADFDLDGDVDGVDQSIWQSHFGLAEGALRRHGNADNDEDVDGGDFLVWQRQFHETVSFAATGAIIPEPGSGWLAVSAWLAMIGLWNCLASEGTGIPPRRREHIANPGRKP
ncbi:MAG: hypothetical protein KDA61_11065, partial [Planctomycetales bacterium]|nr:hypothetical protein [Planctomycetales bacterium]